MVDRKSTKGRIEAAALRLFVEKGVAQTSVRDIAGAVGLSDGALYRHFPSKDELIWSLFSTGFEGYARTLEGLAAGHSGSRAKIVAMVRGFCELFDADSRLFRFLLLVQHGQLSRVTPKMANPIETVRTVIAAGMARGEIPKGDPDLGAAMVMGIILQTATFKVYGRIVDPLGELADRLAAACWSVLGVPTKG